MTCIEYVGFHNRRLFGGSLQWQSQELYHSELNVNLKVNIGIQYIQGVYACVVGYARVCMS